MPIQVINSAGNVLWTTDKCQINSASNDVSYQVVAPALGTASAVGNLYANAISVPGNTVSQYYVGAGNYLNIVTGAGGFTATALGTATSATAASNGIATPAT